MMRLRAFIVAMVGLGVGVSTLASIQSLANAKSIVLSQSSADMMPSSGMVEVITSGHVHHLYTMSETWSSFNGLMPMRNLIDPAAAWVMFVIVTMTFYLVRYRLKNSFASVGLWCLLGSLLPYTMGAVALTENVAVGPWSTTMLASLLYGSVACTVFATANFFKIHAVRSKFLKQLEKNKEVLKKKIA